MYGLRRRPTPEMIQSRDKEAASLCGLYEMAGKISNIRLFYHLLSEEIIADNLDSLKYLCGDFLTPVRLEKIDNAKQLLSAIGEVVESESKQLELLKELFEEIGRRDLKSKVEEFQQSRNGRLLYSLKNTIN